MITEVERLRVKGIANRLHELEEERTKLQNELIAIRERCDHPSLPTRNIGEQYMDVCPDCGYTIYCYLL